MKIDPEVFEVIADQLSGDVVRPITLKNWQVIVGAVNYDIRSRVIEAQSFAALREDAGLSAEGYAQQDIALEAIFEVQGGYLYREFDQSKVSGRNAAKARRALLIHFFAALQHEDGPLSMSACEQFGEFVGLRVAAAVLRKAGYKAKKSLISLRKPDIQGFLNFILKFDPTE